MRARTVARMSCIAGVVVGEGADCAEENEWTVGRGTDVSGARAWACG